MDKIDKIKNEFKKIIVSCVDYTYYYIYLFLIYLLTHPISPVENGRI